MKADSKTNEELVELIQRGENIQNYMELLYKQNYGLIHKLALHYSPSEDEIKDLEQEGYIGLVNAVKHYDPSKGTAFVTVLYPCLQTVMGRYTRYKCRLISLGEQGKRIRQYNELCEKLDRNPDKAEIMKGLEIDEIGYQLLWDALRASEVDSLNEPIIVSDGHKEEEKERGEVIPSPHDVEEECTESFMVRSFWESIQKILKSKEKEVIEGRFIDERTLEDIGKDYGNTRERIRQIEKKAIEKLQNSSDMRHYAQAYSITVPSAVYHDNYSGFKRRGSSLVEEVAIRNCENVE